MAITVDFPSQVIDVPQGDLTPTANPQIFNLNLDPFFKNELRKIEASEEGIVYPVILNYVPPITIGSVTLAAVIEIINGYTVTFEDLQYAVNLLGGNTNLQDVSNVNQVSIRPSNSAGLILVSGGGGGGLTPQQVADAVWDEPIASHQNVGSTGEALSDAAAGGGGGGGLTPGQEAQLQEIFDKLPTDNNNISSDQQVADASGTWTEQEKDDIIEDVEITKRQALKAANNTEKTS